MGSMLSEKKFSSIRMARKDDEFFEAAMENAIRMAKMDPEGFKQSCLEAQQVDSQIRLVRFYPVYKGETEAHALKRKLAEERIQAREND